MKVVAVDLASRYSASCALSFQALGGYEVLWQLDSWLRVEDQFLSATTESFETWVPGNLPDVLVIEDLPHRLPFAALVKRVCRMQGRLVEKMARNNELDKMLFVPPALWQRSYEGVWRKGPGAVVGVAQELGYSPPDLGLTAETPIRGKPRQVAKKVQTDYCAAYLIARWAINTYLEHGTFDVPQTSRYVSYQVG